MKASHDKSMIRSVYSFIAAVGAFNILFFLTPLHIHIPYLPFNAVILAAELIVPIIGGLIIAGIIDLPRRGKGLQLLAVTGLMVLMFGFGMHFTANTINRTGVTGVSLYQMNFFDEYMGHFLMGLGAFPILIILFLDMGKIRQGLALKEKILIPLSSSLTIGVTGFLFATEANQGFFYVSGSILMMSAILLKLKRDAFEDPIAVMLLSGFAFSYLLIFFL